VGRTLSAVVDDGMGPSGSQLGRSAQQPGHSTNRLELRSRRGERSPYVLSAQRSVPDG